jgi:hypothetical protein
MQEEKKTFKIPSDRMDFFKDKFEKLVKKAKKLGCDEPSYKILGETQIKYTTESGRKASLPAFELEVFGHAPIIDGWEFVGAIEHLPEGNIVKKIGDTDLTGYINSGPDCDHCRIRRQRNQTFILKNEKSEMKQVGSTCLVDFLGHKSPENIASMASMFADFYDLCEGLEEELMGFGGGGTPKAFPMDTFLTMVRVVILKKGWVPRSKSDEITNPATCDIAWMALTNNDVAKLFAETSEADVKHAIDAMNWAAELPDEETNRNEYLHNIRLQARRGFAERKFIGYCASILPAYDKYLSRKAEQDSAKGESKHIGSIGDKLELNVTLIHVTHVPNNFSRNGGESALSVFKDAEGNTYKWFGTGFGESDFKIGETKTMWATVKDHEEYKGVKQTSLTRCTLTEPGWAKKAKKKKSS